MNARKMIRRIGAFALSAVLVSSAVCVSAAEASGKELDIKYTYTGGNYTFEKISHVNSPTETNDGVVDYLGNGTVGAYVPGVSEEGNGDRGQSYSYAAASYGD